MTITEQLEQLLDTSRERLCTETHDRSQTTASAYARSLWALEADLRQLADRLEGISL